MADENQTGPQEQVTRSSREYERVARLMAAHIILTSHDLGCLTVELHSFSSLPPDVWVENLENDIDDVWEIVAWEDVREGSAITYVGSDLSLRRMALQAEANGQYDVLHWHHGEPDEGDFSFETVSSYHTGREEDDANTESDNPIHLLTLYPKGTLSRKSGD